MRIDLKDIGYAVETANEISEQYKMYVLAGDHYPRSIDDLLWMCKTHLNKNIESFELDAAAPHDSVSGTYLKFLDKYVIITQPAMNYCWRRFVVCKELFHVLLDQPQYRISNIAEHLADIESCFPILESEPHATTVSEVLAEIAAVQFLYPYAQRVLLLSDTPEYLKIAHQFKIPQVMVEKYMSAGYMSNLSVFNPKE